MSEREGHGEGRMDRVVSARLPLSPKSTADFGFDLPVP